MNKEHFEKEIDEINVPVNEVLAAIDNGISKGKKTKRRSRIKLTGTVSSAAAASFLASGLIFGPVSNVLADVPLIGGIYEKYSLQIGQELFESNLVTQLNEKASSNGVDVTVTGAYYDGNVIGITIKADGNSISLDNGGESGPEAGYGFHLFDGEEQTQWSASFTELQQAGEGYTAALEFHNPGIKLPEQFTLPITFTAIGGQKGTWRFDVPVSKIASETISLEAESVSDGGNYSLNLESLIKGKATTILNYKAVFPINGKEDQFNLSVVDNNGNKLIKSSADVLSTETADGAAVKEIRELFSSKIDEQAKYLTVYPEIRKYERDTFRQIKDTPFTIESKRFDYQIRINGITRKNSGLTIDYTIQNIDQKAFDRDIINNFAHFIMLVKTKNIYMDKNGEIDMNETIAHRIRSTETVETDSDTLRFKSTFILNNKNARLSDYAISVPFGTLSLNSPVKMNSIKIDLGK